ncbi:BTB/POZ domain-containing protein At5g47800-like [Nymphaea colorata]|nr:BTB/POZ domain-containing protein At5g47800-like [Nymphaea colorata]
MKFMKIGTRLEAILTKEATRYVTLDVSSDLTVQVNNTKYLLHKFPLLSKCGLLQQLCDPTNSDNQTVELHEIPGGEEAFELCIKFCYGISINLSAHNIVQALCASHFLQMSDALEKGNLTNKLEYFFGSVLQAWKDSILALQTTQALPTWSENLNITGRCVDAIARKIWTDLTNVTWSYTYTRAGFIRKAHAGAPRDWWTEDVADLDLQFFRRVILVVRSSIPPALVGEALHVYACQHLPDELDPNSSGSVVKHREILEFIVSQIPTRKGSVSTSFLLRLLRLANQFCVSDRVVAEIMRLAGRQLEEAKLVDLLKLRSSPSCSTSFNYIDMVKAMAEHFLVEHRRTSYPDSGERQSDSERSHQSMTRVAKLIDSYLFEIAADPNLPVTKVIELTNTLPDNARADHDDLYRVIDTYLKEHPDISKSEKKKLCHKLDCRKLSTDACMHAVQNDQLPLRTVVQVLLQEHVRAAMAMSPVGLHGNVKAMLSAPTGDMAKDMTLATKGKDPMNGRMMASNVNGQRSIDQSSHEDHQRRGMTSPPVFDKATIEAVEVDQASEIAEEDDSKSRTGSKVVNFSGRPATSEVTQDGHSKKKMKPKRMPSISSMIAKLTSKLPIQKQR